MKHKAPGASLAGPEKKKKLSKAKIGGGLLALLVLGSCLAQGADGDKKADPAPATTTASAAAPAATSAPAATTAAPTSAAPATTVAAKADTAASLVERMDCTDKVLSQAKLDADALTPRWVGQAKSVAACTKGGFTQVVVAEYASKDEALQAVARAQDITGWHNRVTVDGRFARGASGNEWSSVDFPKAQQ